MAPRFVRICLVLLLVVGSTVTSTTQTTATRHVMKEKLAHSQLVLEALMKSDVALLEREAEALTHATELPGWAVLTTPEYVRYSNAFLKVTRELLAAARDHDLDTVATQYAAMTSSCYQCHRYLKNTRIAAHGAPVLPRRVF
jgi:hypothetical protein